MFWSYGTLKGLRVKKDPKWFNRVSKTQSKISNLDWVFYSIRILLWYISSYIFFQLYHIWQEATFEYALNKDPQVVAPYSEDKTPCCPTLQWWKWSDNKNLETSLCICITCKFTETYINDLVQDCSISTALAMEILQSCSKPSICISELGSSDGLSPVSM